MKTNSIVTVFNLLNSAKINKVSDSGKIKVVKAVRQMKPIATSFDELLNDAREKLKGEEHDEMAEKAGPGAEGLTMLPHLCGSTMPVYNPDARGAFWGMTLAHGKGHFARAILEAVAFTLKDDLECIGAEADEIRITGGGATSPLWAQIKADVTGLNLSTLQEKESACLGTAIMAGVGCGVYSSIEEACKGIIKTKKTYSPQGVDYTKAYNKYKKLDKLLNISED